MTNKTKTLYEHYKNSPKKLKIVCDWDEVIQATEPYSLWLTVREKDETLKELLNFSDFFKRFWSKNEENWWKTDYDNHGVGLRMLVDKEGWRKYKISSFELEYPDDFYDRTPFLTIAEDLLKLIKEDKVEELIFLTNSSGVGKREMLEETFAKLKNCKVSLRLMPKERKMLPYPRTKAEWVKKNAFDCDVFIDDNPNICRDVFGLDLDIHKNKCRVRCEGLGCSNYERNINVLAPYYPAIENQHHPEVLLLKNEVSNLKKEDFSK